MHLRRAVLVAGWLPLLIATSVATPAAAAPTSGHRGAAGAGDPYFPRQGNGGYQVRYYSLKIGYQPSRKHLRGDATIHAVTRTALARFDLDLRRNLHVSSVTVNGHRARFSQPAGLVQELVITPRATLARHQRFTVAVHYAGRARPITDPGGSPDGFITTGDGAFVASEPQGSPTWFPVNDTPDDKATYRVAITVPRHLAALSNGRLLSRRTRDGRTTWSWKLTRPVSSYLVTATIGRFRVTTGTTPSGIPYVDAVATKEKSANRTLKQLPAIIDFFSRRYGRYPWPQTGAIVDHVPSVGYALEVATRPLFESAPTIGTLSHELAHQWFGDDVTVARWRDIWLNEGFAEFSQWLWDEHRGAETARQHLAAVLAHPASDTSYWNPPPGNPGTAARIFADSVYARGAATLQALREKLGGTVFFRIMKGWVAAHRYGNATVGRFTAFAARTAHRDLTGFFHRWLYASGKP
jgi:aminopeptidase N